MNKLVFTTGGARSGKSTFAEELAIELNQSFEDKQIAYIATAESTDEEFDKRIEKHKGRRGKEYANYEEPINISSFLIDKLNQHNIFIIECLATWLGNIYYKFPDAIEENINNEINKLLNVISQNDKYERKSQNSIDQIKMHGFQNSTEELFKNNSDDKIIIIVSNEVGMGIVPENKMVREYRDNLGFINKKIADTADYVFICNCGIPNRIK